MKTIFIIDGTSGIWKSDLINYVTTARVKSDIIRKSSTRPKKPEDISKTRTDLKFIDEDAFNSFNFEFQYYYDGYQYGFFKKEVEDLLQKVDNIFVVIRNLDLIQEFSKQFSKYNIVSAFIYTDFDVVSKRIPNAIHNQHKKSIEDTFQDYLRHPDIYDEIIINGGTANDFNRLLDLLVIKYTNITKEEINTSEEQTRIFCRKLAIRKANFFLITVVLICFFLWVAFIYTTVMYSWEAIEPKFSIATVPILSVGFIYLWFLITGRTFTINPKEMHNSIVNFYEKKYLLECSEK